MAIFHCNEEMEAVVVNYPDICKDSYMPNHKIKLIKIPLKSVEEARRRVAVLALLTFSIMRGPNLFVKLFTHEQLEDSTAIM